ncbi:hypothetical protein KAS24_05040 [Candidatus Bathyarchaeota archaeon]|nr:hypothetical protein [Candidatus Bathyarchaeota archaeon]
MAVCPNPKCRRDIEEPILLTIHSVTPAKKYKACPCCFANLEPELPIEQKDVPEPTIYREEVMEKNFALSLSVNSVLEKVKDSAPQLVKKVKALMPISNLFQKEKMEKTKEPQAEPSGKEEKAMKEEPKTKPSAEKKEGSSGCSHTFGYLAIRPPDTPIPQECLICPKIVDCMLKTGE